MPKNNALRLLFVHVAKAGGTSINHAIANTFPEEKIFRDYGDGLGDPRMPISFDPVRFLSKSACAHGANLTGKFAVTGHLWAKKYDKVDIDVRAAVLRDPIERAISHFYFWKYIWRGDNIIQNYILSEELTFIEFCNITAIKTQYTSLYFKDTDMRLFDTIINYDVLKQNWDSIMSELGLSSGLVEVNATSERVPFYREQRDDILHNPKLMSNLRGVFKDDYRFFEKYTGWKKYLPWI